MSQIGGIYTPGIQTIDITGVTTGPKHIVHSPKGQGAHNGPVCAIIADASAGAVDATLTINRGTFTGGTFTLVQRLAFISILAGTTQSQSILKVIGTEETFQFIVTGDGSTKSHIRIEGRTISV